MLSFTPIVSVLMPVFNAEAYLKLAIDSVLQQSYSNIELLICDDCSTDDSRRIIELYDDRRIVKFYNSHNFGYLKTCNRLFQEATGDYIAFQDADDWSELDRIEKIMSAFDERQNMALCGCNFVRKDSRSGKINLSSDYPTDHRSIVEYSNNHQQLPFCGASVVLKKSVYETIGGYRVFFDRIGYEHFDWFMLIMEKFEVGNIADRLYNYRYVKDSFSRTNKLFDYKKFNASKMAWFLKKQREKYGFDALQNESVRDEFETCLEKFEIDFWKNRPSVYKSIIFQLLSNKEYKQSLNTALEGFKRREIGTRAFMYYIYRTIRTVLKNLTTR